MLDLRNMSQATSPLREKAEQLTVEYIQKGCEALNISPFHHTLDFELTGKTAGKAWSRSCHISLNWPLLLQEGEAFLSRTVPHEVAHLLDYAKFRNHGHGRTWKYCMEVLGVSDITRCHSYDIQHVSRTQVRFDYVCANGHKSSLSATRHNKLKKAPNAYCCGWCYASLSQAASNSSQEDSK